MVLFEALCDEVVDGLRSSAHLLDVGGDLVLGADGIGFTAAYLDPSRAVPDLDLVAQREVGRDLLQGDADAGDRIRAVEVDHQRGVGLARLRPAGVGVAVGHVRDDGAGVLVGCLITFIYC